MSRIQPKACRPEAFEEFHFWLPRIETLDGLWGAALAVSMHAMDDVDPDAATAKLDALAERVLSRVHTDSFEAKWARLHEVLFEEEGMAGNYEHYYNPMNSYLGAVLESRKGLPITLALVYKAVAERVGLQVQGVNAPGHFLVSVQENGRQTLVDPFMGGRVLTEEEAAERISNSIGIRLDQIRFPVATHTAWLRRILRNLQHVFSVNQHFRNLAAISELAEALADQRCENN